LNPEEARELGKQIRALLDTSQTVHAYELLIPVINGRIHFRILDILAKSAIGAAEEPMNLFLDSIAACKAEGGWPVIGSILRERLKHDMAFAFECCRRYAMIADIWYATDILGERVPGPALLFDFKLAIRLLEDWRFDPNPWIRRMVGVAVHFWAKRAHGDQHYSVQGKALLEFLTPMFEEHQLDAIKGIGWGLKTLGRYYPDLTTPWLNQQIVIAKRKPRSLMLRKALTYLPSEKQLQAIGKK
jgi:hypothetical protein